jgi:hypothetical protein
MSLISHLQVCFVRFTPCFRRPSRVSMTRTGDLGWAHRDPLAMGPSFPPRDTSGAYPHSIYRLPGPSTASRRHTEIFPIPEAAPP